MKNVRKLTEGAILLAAFTVLLLVCIYVPIIGGILNLFLPLPFILFATKNNLKNTCVFVFASILLSFITGAIVALPLTLAYGLTGAIMGYFIQKNKSRTIILLAGTVVFLVNIVIQYVVTTTFFHFDIIDKFIKMFHESLKIYSQTLKDMGKEKQGKPIIDRLEKSLDLIKIIVPSVFVMSSFLAVFFIQLLSRPVLKRFGVKVENWKPFREISLPKSLMWYYLITMMANLTLHPVSGTYLYNALVNLTYILQMFMFFQGLTFIFYFFYQRGMPKSIPLIIFLFSLTNSNFLYIIGILGIIDLGFDVRRRFLKKE
ncbi:MAG: YybS family protein [Bacillota bacterium]|nr:YybS family protein [Bacillota bacterium]